VADQPTFLGWDAPPISLLSDWLTAKYSEGSLLDLSGITIVLPSTSGVRQLQQSLVQYANEQQLAFLPPDITTIGGLPERLYPHKSAATDAFQQLAWYKAVTDKALSGSLNTFLPIAPAPQQRQAWQELAVAVANVHRELSGEGLRFENIVSHCNKNQLRHEERRWKQLQLIQEAYFNLLDEHQVWDLQSARVMALKNQEISFDSSELFVVAGCTDLNSILRGFLASISAQTEFIVFAPVSMRSRFDQVGCLITEKWDASVPAIPPEDISIASDPTHQAELILDLITRMPADVATTDILIATPDVGDEKELIRQLQTHHLQANPPTGMRLTDTRIIVLLRLLHNYLRDISFSALSGLLRHPDVGIYILSSIDISSVLTELTEYHEARLPLDDSDIQAWSKRYPSLAKAAAAIRNWCEPLLKLEDTSQNIHDGMLAVLTKVYGELSFQRDTHIAEIKALSAITNTSHEMLEAYEQLHISCNNDIFFTHLLATLSQSNVPVIPDSDAITISGWLDAPWSAHNTVIVSGINEGIVPTTSNTDLFLQDNTRQALGLNNNQRRLARDAYTLALLQNSRNLVCLCKRSNQQGDPLPISRLLLHGPVTQQADLIKRYSSGQTTIASHQLKEFRPIDHLPVLEITVAPHQPEAISVTALRSYLACPVRFYLNSVLRLQSIDDYSKELSPLTFGNLVHNVLHAFGISEVRDSIDSSEISEYLKSSLSQHFRRNHGNSTFPAVRLQIQQLHHRFDAFAQWQANWRTEGWKIIEAEYQPVEPITVHPDFPECKIRGRIDRIDYNPQKDTYAIFDYKTSESSDPPEKTHKSSKPPGWSDLQLPMYRHLCKALTGDAGLLLGYITLGKDLSSIGAQFANWDETALNDADKVAVEVIRSIRAGEFTELNDDVPAIFDDYADLFGKTTLDHPGHIIKEVNK